MSAFEKRPWEWRFDARPKAERKRKFKDGIDNIKLNVDCRLASSFNKHGKKHKHGISWTKKRDFIKNNGIEKQFRRLEFQISAILLDSCKENMLYMLWSREN